MKKFRTGTYRELIQTIEVTKESDKTVWFKLPNGSEDRCLKQSDSYQVFDSFEEAKEFLLNKNNSKLERLNNQVKSQVELIEQINKLSL